MECSSLPMHLRPCRSSGLSSSFGLLTKLGLSCSVKEAEMLVLMLNNLLLTKKLNESDILLFVEIGRKRDRTVEVAVAVGNGLGFDVKLSESDIFRAFYVDGIGVENVVIQLVLLDGMPERLTSQKMQVDRKYEGIVDMDGSVV